jgi:DNA polymerase V
MSFDARSLERLKQLGRTLPQPLAAPEPPGPGAPSGDAKAAERRHRVETETDPAALFRELMKVSPDGEVPPHLLDRLRQAEGESLRASPASGASRRLPNRRRRCRCRCDQARALQTHQPQAPRCRQRRGAGALHRLSAAAAGRRRPHLKQPSVRLYYGGPRGGPGRLFRAPHPPSVPPDLPATDLNTLLIPHPRRTFLLRVSGESMIGAGIHPGDLLIVDRHMEPRSGRIVVAELEGAFTLKRLVRRRGGWWLEACHPAYPPLPLGSTEGAGPVRIWGVAIHAIRSL